MITIGTILVLFGSCGLLPAKNEQEEKNNTPIFLAIGVFGGILVAAGYLTLN